MNKLFCSTSAPLDDKSLYNEADFLYVHIVEECLRKGVLQLAALIAGLAVLQEFQAIPP
jgi:hypothetical protein